MTHRGKCNGKACFICYPKKLKVLERKVQILRSRGLSAQTISVKLGMGYQPFMYALRKYLPDLHTQVSHRGCPGASCVLCVPAQAEKLRSYVKQGMTRPEVASQLGMTDVGLGVLVRRHFPDLCITLDVSAKRKRSSNAKKRWLKFRANEKPSPRVLTMMELSKQGYGIDWIGKKLACDGTNVRYHLKRHLSSKEYAKRHSTDRYCGGPKGYRRNERGDPIQSSYEEVVADYFYRKGIRYTMHKTLQHKGKVFYPDFYLLDADVYVEVLGLLKYDFYRKRVRIKKRTYAKLGIICLWFDASSIKRGKLPPDFKHWVKTQTKASP